MFLALYILRTGGISISELFIMCNNETVLLYILFILKVSLISLHMYNFYDQE